MANIDTDELTITDVGHLPIVKQYAKQINIVETIDAMVQSEMQVSPGLTVFAMVLDTLSGRSPLYRLQKFFEDKDNELLLGEAVDEQAQSKLIDKFLANLGDAS